MKQPRSRNEEIQRRKKGKNRGEYRNEEKRKRGNEESSQFVNVKICECGNEIQGDCQRCEIAATLR